MINPEKLAALFAPMFSRLDEMATTQASMRQAQAEFTGRFGGPRWEAILEDLWAQERAAADAHRGSMREELTGAMREIRGWGKADTMPLVPMASWSLPTAELQAR